MINGYKLNKNWNKSTQKKTKHEKNILVNRYIIKWSRYIKVRTSSTRAKNKNIHRGLFCDPYASVFS